MKCCGTCEYSKYEYHDKEWICTNDESGAYGFETEYDDYCTEYEEKEEN